MGFTSGECACIDLCKSLTTSHIYMWSARRESRHPRVHRESSCSAEKINRAHCGRAPDLPEARECICVIWSLLQDATVKLVRVLQLACLLRQPRQVVQHSHSVALESLGVLLVIVIDLVLSIVIRVDGLG